MPTLAVGVGLLLAWGGCGYHSMASGPRLALPGAINVTPFAEASANGVAGQLQRRIIVALRRHAIAAQARAPAPHQVRLVGSIQERVAGSGAGFNSRVPAYRLHLGASFELLAPATGTAPPQPPLLQARVAAAEDYLAGADTVAGDPGSIVGIDRALRTEGARDVAESRAVDILAQRIARRILLHLSGAGGQP